MNILQGVCVWIFIAGGSIGLSSVTYAVLSKILSDPDVWMSMKVAVCGITAAAFATIIGAIAQAVDG